MQRLRALYERVQSMDDATIELFAKRDPDIFRDVARAYVAVLNAPPVARSASKGDPT